MSKRVTGQWLTPDPRAHREPTHPAMPPSPGPGPQRQTEIFTAGIQGQKPALPVTFAFWLSLTALPAQEIALRGCW